MSLSTKKKPRYFGTRSIVQYLSVKEHAAVVTKDTVAYYDKRTDEQNIKAIQAKIANVRKEVEDLTTAYVKARNDLLRETIENQMGEYELLLNDLREQEAKLELERGYKLTEQDILDFIDMIIHGDTADKEFQKRVIDNLVKWIYVYDDHKLVLLNIQNNKSIEKLTDEETDDILLQLEKGSAACSDVFVSAHHLPATAREGKSLPFFVVGSKRFDESKKRLSQAVYGKENNSWIKVTKFRRAFARRSGEVRSPPRLRGNPDFFADEKSRHCFQNIQCRQFIISKLC